MKYQTFGRIVGHKDDLGDGTRRTIVSTPLVVTDEHPASSYGVPVVLLDGEPVDYALVAYLDIPQSGSSQIMEGIGTDFDERVDWFKRMPIDPEKMSKPNFIGSAK